MDVIREKAKQDYMKGMKYKDICEKYSLSINTLKSWVKRYGWADERKKQGKKCAHKRKRGAYEKEGVYTDKNHEKEVAEKIVKNVTKNEELTDKQQLFCIYYLKYFNATKAYQKAYGCDYLTANANGPRLLANASIKQQIEKLKSERMEGIYLDGKDILQKYIDIAFADITDYASFGQEEVVVDIDDEGEPIKRKINVVKLKDSDEIDGTIVTEVSKGRDGVKIKLADKMKALEKLEKYFDILPDNHKRRLEEEKLKLEREKFEFIKRKEEGDEDALEKLDRLIEAIDNEAKR